MNVTPRPKMTPTADKYARLRELNGKKDALNAEIRGAVIDASNAGGSVRVIAEASGLSKTTVQKYIAEARTQG